MGLINIKQSENSNETEYITTSSTKAARVSVVKTAPVVGTKFRVEGYCEIFKTAKSGGEAEVEFRASGSGTGDVALGFSAQDTDQTWMEVNGKDIFEVTISEDITFSIMFGSGQPGSEVKIRRARIWIEQLPEGS